MRRASRKRQTKSIFAHPRSPSQAFVLSLPRLRAAISGMEPAYAALPQRAPRLRRQDSDAAQRDAATAAAAEGPRGGEKRARDAAAPPDEAELARQLSRRSDAELPGTVVVAWSEAAAAEHYECAFYPRLAHSDAAECRAHARLRRHGPHGRHPAPRLCALPRRAAFRPGARADASTPRAPQGAPPWRRRSGGQRCACSTIWCAQAAPRSRRPSKLQPHARKPAARRRSLASRTKRRTPRATCSSQVRSACASRHCAFTEVCDAWRAAAAHDMQSLLFAFLDELLFVFSTEMFVVRELRLGPINRDSWELHVTACVLSPACGACLADASSARAALAVASRPASTSKAPRRVLSAGQPVECTC